jgi:hypothetical protein
MSWIGRVALIAYIGGIAGMAAGFNHDFLMACAIFGGAAFIAYGGEGRDDRWP